MLVRQVHTRPVQHGRLIYIFFYIYILYIYIYIYIYVYVYIRRACWTGSRVNLLKNIPPNVSYENCSHFWEIFRFWGVDFFDFLGSKNIFNLCSHIEFNTQNPNPILKITISFTKTPKKPKHFRKNEKIWKISKIQNFQKLKFLFCILYTFHNSYFLYFYSFL